MIINSFQHKMAAHCETGSITAALNFRGMDISEPMIFGIGSGIFFGYFKTPRFAFPIFTVRSRPGDIRKNVSKLLGVKFHTARYKCPEKAEKELDELLSRNIPVAVQVDFFYMDYVPPHERVHNNMHFIHIIGKNGTKYIVSDSYFPEIVEVESTSLTKGRFAKGSMAPKGFMYHLLDVPSSIDYEKAIIKGIKKACFYMLKTPIPFIGVRGIFRFAEKLKQWPKYARDVEHLSHEVMKIHVLLEDQGTGGGGFRFIYATFLNQAAQILKNDTLKEMSEQMMLIGDKWRMVSLFAARIGKNRTLDENNMNELSSLIKERAEEEKVFFNTLYNFAKKFSKRAL